MTEALIHFGYALMLVALMARDVLWLRSVLVVAQSLLAAYGALNGIVGMAAWNAAFVLINAVWAVRIVAERRSVQLPPELAALHQNPFAAFTAREFLRFWQGGVDHTFATGQALTASGDAPAYLHLVTAGRVSVQMADRPALSLGPGRFVGEMSFITGMPASADVRADGVVITRAWPVQTLRAQAKTPLSGKLLSAIGFDLVHKIRRSQSVGVQSSGSQAGPS